jgi:two-component system cell cycle response regulator
VHVVEGSRDAQEQQRKWTATPLPAEVAAEVLALTSKNEQLTKTVSRLQTALRRMEALAHLDPLTGLANRRQFLTRLELEIRRCARVEEPLTLVICDVDRFKRFNDTFGHPIGDRLLIDLSRLLQRHCRRGGDMAVRYAGDEFVLLWPGVTYAAARRLADEIRLAAHGLRPRQTGAQISVTLSVGVTTFDGRGYCDYERLVRTGDRALYRAKRSGRDRTVGIAFHST